MFKTLDATKGRSRFLALNKRSTASKEEKCAFKGVKFVFKAELTRSKDIVRVVSR